MSPALSVRGLSVALLAGDDLVVAPNDISFDVPRGKTLGLVGESGAGKSMTLRALIGLLPRSAEVVAGSAIWNGRQIDLADREAVVSLRGSEIGMIFQDPSSCLSPVFSIGNQLTEVLRLHRGLDRGAARAAAADLLDRVGIPSPRSRLNDYPHQFSGGMKQRVMVAIALACQPGLLLADEPTTALDVTIQDQLLTLLSEVQSETHMTMVLVSHDLAVISRSCDLVAVMYAGRCVEYGPVDSVLRSPRHPYTGGLLAALPTIELALRQGKPVPITGQPPDLTTLPPGCSFAPRCPFRERRCDTISMELDRSVSEHGSACPFVDFAAVSRPDASAGAVR